METTQAPQTTNSKLADIAKGVTANYESLEICEVLNRIHYVTGANYQRCIAGLKKMIAEKLISPEFILNEHLLPKLEKIIDSAFPLMQTLDAELVPTKESITLSVGSSALDGPTDDDENLFTHLPKDF